MTDQPQQTAALRANLEELARLLPEAEHLDPETRESLAGVVAELADAAAAGSLEPGSIAHLTETTGHLVEALRHEHHGPLAGVRDRLQRAVARAEVEAPVATGFLERLIDALSNIGI